VRDAPVGLRRIVLVELGPALEPGRVEVRVLAVLVAVLLLVDLEREALLP
jgi:hypothetical protein